tara:strand:+ start:579 stop:737 length:159 start_codon:yes stop_codon:yes gene_type:complete
MFDMGIPILVVLSVVCIIAWAMRDADGWNFSVPVIFVLYFLLWALFQYLVRD